MTWFVSSPLQADGRGCDEAHGGLQHLARRLHRLVLLLLHLIEVIFESLMINS